MSKQIRIKNLDIKFSDYMTKEQVKEAIERGFAGVDLANEEPVYLVKIHVGNMRADQAYYVLKHIREDCKALGLTSCLYVPICESGIQDIEIVEVTNETV